MWELKSEKEDEETIVVHYALPDGELLVGRKECDILISKDPSVSRKHASIRTSHSLCNVGNLNFKSVCLLKDFGSKYGTFVNGKQVGEEGVILKHDDLITFGQCGSNYRVTFKPIVVTSSCMNVEEKATLKEIARKLGGHVIDEWKTECTHLAMARIKVTVKTVCALASTKPIVNLSYFKMLLNSYTKKIPPENPENFLPELDEVILNQQTVSFTVNPARRLLFKDRTFIFLTQHQYRKLYQPITLASGKPILLNKSRCDLTEDLLLSSSVIHYPVDGANTQSSLPQSQKYSSKEIEDIERLLRHHKKRFVPESDIGLAVVHCSIQQYCNPDYEFDSTQSTSFSKRLQSQTLSQGCAYVPETLESTNQSLTSTRSKITEIPATFRTSTEPSMSTNMETEEEATAQSKKRSAPSEANNNPASKVLKMEPHTDSQDLFPTAASCDLNCDTQPSPVKNNANTSHKTDTSTKRNLPGTSSLTKNDHETEIIRSVKKIKVEVSSPPASPETLHNTTGFNSYHNASTQLVSQSLFVNETQKTESRALKSTRLYAESANHEKQKSACKTDTADSKRTSKNSTLLPIKTRKTSEESVSENKENVEELPSNLLVVQLADLYIRRKAYNTVQRESNRNQKNFKKFTKTANCGANSLPRIIGEDDLVVYTSKDNINEMSEILQHQGTEQTQASLASNTSFRAQFAKISKNKK